MITPITFKQNPSTLNKIAKKANIRNWSDKSKKMLGMYYPVIGGGAAIGATFINPALAVAGALAMVASYIKILQLCSTVKGDSEKDVNVVA